MASGSSTANLPRSISGERTAKASAGLTPWTISLMVADAMQRDVEAAAKLGLTDAEARSLARLYWTDIYPENLPEYSTPDCRNGGPYDLHPHDSRWP